jgi:hypothetical protein
VGEAPRMRERERVGEWWIEVRPGPSCGEERGVSLLGWCCGREEDGRGLKGGQTYGGHFARGHFLRRGRLGCAAPDIG